MRKVSWFAALVLAPLCLLNFTAAARPGAPKAPLHVVRATARATDGTRTSPTSKDVANAVVKALLAVALNEASKPQPRDDFGDALARGLARAGRDRLIDSALQDLSPRSKPVERAAVRGLVVLALDGKLSRDRDRVLNYLKKTNPDMADAVEVTEFLIQLAQAVDKKK